MGQYTSYWMYQKYETRGEQDPIPVYPNYWSVDADGTLPKITKLENDEECGYRPDAQYRWVNMDITKDYYCDECGSITRWVKSDETICVEIEPQYRTLTTATTCVGYDLHVLKEHQVSTDGGVTWTTTATTTGSLIEADSEDCGYIPPTRYKWIATYRDTDETVVSAECDASSAITQDEIPKEILPTRAGPKTVQIGDCVNTIGYKALYDLTLQSVSIGTGVTFIGADAFEYTSIVEGLIINATTPPSLGAQAFEGSSFAIYVPCESLYAYITHNDWSEYINRLQGIPPCGQAAKWLATYTGGTTSSAQCDSTQTISSSEVNKNGLASITINSCVKSIGNQAFLTASTLTSVTIPDSVTSIGNGAFYGCSRLKTITIPNSVVSIGNTAFQRSGLESCTIGTGLTSIGEEAFSSANSLTSIIIPDNVVTVGSQSFHECRSLTSCTVGSGTTDIGTRAFEYCYNLTNATIGSGNLLASTFRYCTGLTSCTIGSGVTSIGSEAFGHCSSLTSIDIPNSVTNIGREAFSGCTSLTTCAIGSGVTSIGNNAFNNCSSLTGITIPSGVTSIEPWTFVSCSSLTNLVIPDNVTNIGSGACYNCSSLTSITIPSGITEIFERTFYGCSSLTSVTIPSGVTSIYGRAFSGCSHLQSITINATTPPTLKRDSQNYDSQFYGTNSCPIYVPAESVEMYKTYSKWSDYKSRIRAIP